MKSTILIILLLLSIIPVYAEVAVAKSSTCESYRDEAVYWNVIAETTQYYSEQGFTRNPRVVSTFLGSAYRVAMMTSNFPATDQDERMLRLFSWGSKESGYREHFYQINIPGKRYPGLPDGITVKAMSVDYGWSGLNEQNVGWTYVVACCVQDSIPFPSWVSTMMPKATQEFIRKNLAIPPSMKLKKIDLATAKNAHGLYKAQKKKGVKPEKMKIWVNYYERTQDDLDSLLIYRWLVEVDRWKRNWSWKTWDVALYSRLQRALTKYSK